MVPAALIMWRLLSQTPSHGSAMVAAPDAALASGGVLIVTDVPCCKHWMPAMWEVSESYQQLAASHNDGPAGLDKITATCFISPCLSPKLPGWQRPVAADNTGTYRSSCTGSLSNTNQHSSTGIV